MDFNLNEEQEMLRKMARDFLTTESPKSLVREMVEDDKGHSEILWQRMAELGWMGLAFPEEYGATGGSFLDLAVLLEEMGRACLPGPFFSSIVLGGMTLMEAGSEEQKQRFLPLLAEGKVILTLAILEEDGQYDPKSVKLTANAEGSDYVLHGTKMFVPDAAVADYIICVARTGGSGSSGITLFLVDAKSQGLSLSPFITLAGDKQYRITWDGVRVPGENILGEKDNGWIYIEKVLQKAVVGLCAMMVGGAQQTLEMTVDYAKERKQFGRPIGSFQIIQHHCTDMATDMDGARFITYQAAWKLSEGLPCIKDISIAKLWTGEAFRRMTSLAVQVHGTLGWMDDHDVPFYYKRAKAWELWLGGADFHQDVVATEMGL